MSEAVWEEVYRGVHSDPILQSLAREEIGPKSNGRAGGAGRDRALQRDGTTASDREARGQNNKKEHGRRETCVGNLEKVGLNSLYIFFLHGLTRDAGT